MKNIHKYNNSYNVNAVSPEAQKAWAIWKILTDFSEWLWDQYDEEFMTLAASEPPPKYRDPDDLPF